MNIIKLDDVITEENKRGVNSKGIVENDDVKVTQIELGEGDYLPEHSVPVNVFFYIVEGKGTLQIGDEKEVVEAKQVITCPPNTTMSLKADQGEEFIVLNVKTPSL